MRHLHPELTSSQRTGERRVNIADHQDPVRFLSYDHGFEPGHYGGCLGGMRGRANLQMNVRRRQFEVAEKHVGHQLVVMLARMNNKRRELSLAPLHGFDDGRHLHDIRPRPDDIDYFEHELASSTIMVTFGALPSSKWQRTASLTWFRRSARPSASVKIETPSARAM